MKHSARILRSTVFVVASAALLGSAYAYVDTKALHNELTTLHTTLSRVETTDGPLCAPEELATAQSLLAEAWREFDEGDYWEAEDYLNEAKAIAADLLEKLPGCRADTDQDGIPNLKDRCPNEPETYNGYLDQDGCPDKPPARAILTPERIEILEPIQFDAVTAEVLPESAPVLTDVARILSENRDLRVRIEAHTDDQLPDEEARHITSQWAYAVKKALVARGIPSDRLFTYGMGRSRPIASNKTALGREMNRRIEFIRISAP